MSKKLIKSKLKSNLYTRDLYTTEEYDYIVSKKIIEYDIKNAGFNLSKYYRLLPDDKLRYLETLNKHDRTIQIGIYMRNDREFNKQLTKSFKRMRKKFFEANELEDKDIVSIKKDAIFVVGKKCKNVKFENVEFVEKNVYSSFHKFGNIELYYNGKENKIDVKGINNDLLYQHESFLNILKRIFKLLEQNDDSGFIKFMKRFTDDYKNKRLNYNYYREFNSNSGFTLVRKSNSYMKNYCISLDGMDESLDKDLDISYNYITYILPILQRFYFKGIKWR